MTKTLKEIISDGTLVDNRVHQATNGQFSAGRSILPIEIYQGRSDKSPGAVWPLLQRASIEINAALRSGISSKIFIFPKQEYEHNTKDDFIKLQGSTPLNFTLTTGNLIGCVKHDKYTLRISSRFGDEFLKYIIADADGFVELPKQGGEGTGDYNWLLVYLWLIKLKKAFRLGLPKAYESRTGKTSQARGRLDPVDYFINHELAQYRCTYREHSYDNDVTRLIANTLEFLDSHSFLRDSHTISQTFQIATQGRSMPIRDLLATKSVRNPYYADYNSVIALSKQILQNEYADFGDQSHTSAFFFDVSMLFEYFIRKLLTRSGVSFHSKTSREWEIPTGLLTGFARRQLIPDLIFDLDGKTYVFDVKYKSFDFIFGVSREDLFQIHTYVGQISNRFSVAGCGFIYPIRESRWKYNNLDRSGGILAETFYQCGRTIPFYVIFLKVPEQDAVADNVWPSHFRSTFKSSCNDLTQNLLTILNHNDLSEIC